MNGSGQVSVSELADRYRQAERVVYHGYHAFRWPRRSSRIVYGDRTVTPHVHNVASWLLTFVQTDLRELSREQSHAIQDQIVVFSRPPQELSAHEKPSLSDLERPPTRRKIEGAQRELRAALERLFKPHEKRGRFVLPNSWALRNVQARRVLFRDENGRIHRGYWGRSFRERFLLSAADLLESVGDRIRRCSECGRLFHAVKRQGYCSSKCSQRVRTREFRAKHKDGLREDRRNKYRARVRARTGPRVRIQQRSRGRLTARSPRT